MVASGVEIASVSVRAIKWDDRSHAIRIFPGINTAFIECALA